MVVAVVWSSVSHFVLGVPYDLIQRARRNGGQAMDDLQDIVRVNINRVMYLSEVAGSLVIVFVTFFLTSLLLLGFFYGFELAQALLFLALPLSIVGIMSFRTARNLAEQKPEGDDLIAALSRFRVWTQFVGMIAIFITALYGMYVNLDVVRYL